MIALMGRCDMLVASRFFNSPSPQNDGRRPKTPPVVKAMNGNQSTVRRHCTMCLFPHMRAILFFDAAVYVM